MLNPSFLLDLSTLSLPFLSISQIYKTHKRVCGKRSSPLRWPELTEKEAKRYHELGSVLDPDSSGRTFAELATPYKLPSRTYAEGYKVRSLDNQRQSRRETKKGLTFFETEPSRFRS